MEPSHIVSTKICMEYNVVRRLGYGLNKLGFESRSEIFSTPNPRPALAPPNLWDSFPGEKRTGREVDHLSPSSAEVKNEWSDSCTPPIRFHGV